MPSADAFIQVNSSSRVWAVSPSPFDKISLTACACVSNDCSISALASLNRGAASSNMALRRYGLIVSKTVAESKEALGCGKSDWACDMHVFTASLSAAISFP